MDRVTIQQELKATRGCRRHAVENEHPDLLGYNMAHGIGLTRRGCGQGSVISLNAEATVQTTIGVNGTSVCYLAQPGAKMRLVHPHLASIDAPAQFLDDYLRNIAIVVLGAAAQVA